MPASTITSNPPILVPVTLTHNTNTFINIILPKPQIHNITRRRITIHDPFAIGPPHHRQVSSSFPFPFLCPWLLSPVPFVPSVPSAVSSFPCLLLPSPASSFPSLTLTWLFSPLLLPSYHHLFFLVFNMVFFK